MALKIVDFDAYVAAKIFEPAEHVSCNIYIVVCLVIPQKILITTTNPVQEADSSSVL